MGDISDRNLAWAQKTMKELLGAWTEQYEKIAELKTLLRELEWLPDHSGLVGCFICDNIQMRGHKESCRLAKALNASERK